MPEGVEDGGEWSSKVASDETRNANPASDETRNANPASDETRSSKAANAANNDRATGSAASDELPTNDAPSVNARMDENAGRPVGDSDENVPCPYCGSTDTHVENARGPSLCRTIYHCDACESPFERFG